MKQFKLLRAISMIMIFSLLLVGPCSISHAATDDPGAGRLSGENIPEEFYEGADNNRISTLSRYGSSLSVSPYTGQTYTHQDQFDGRPISNGIDVSQWQKTIDWQKVKAAGIDYAFIRVGYRGYGDAGTLNESTKDIYFDTNMQNAIAAGVNVGVYIFSQAITTTEAIEEANYILQYIGNYGITLPLVMDYEYASDDSNGGRVKKANLSKEAATEVCMAFCNQIAGAGYIPMVYANASMLTNQLNPQTITDSGYRIWLANYTTNTSYAGKFDFWQYSSTGSVDGITGNTDMNFYYVQEGDNFIPNITGIPIRNTIISPIPDQTYTGGLITPPITITTYEGIPLTQNVDYTVEYANNINLGIAIVTVTGIGQYGGSTQVTFNIVPNTVSPVKAKKRASNYITLKWSKDSEMTGYQIWRANSLYGTYKKIKQISNSTTVTYKDTGLEAGRCYYYKIRKYKKSNGTTYYSEYSPATAIQTTISYSKKAIAKSGATIYNMESQSGEVIATPAKNTSMPVSYSTKDDNGSTWYYVTYNAGNQVYTGYIPAGKVTINMTGKVANTNIVNVRKSSSTGSKVLTTLKKNKKVTILKTKTKKGVTWYKVTFKKSGKTYNGWIAAPYLKLV